jgi:GR25 family glycosyltransferase involved in LPS biosynthesis
MKIIQIGANKANDELSQYLKSNYDSLEFGLFVEANSLHINDIKECYKKYNNLIVENVAIKTPLQNTDKLTIYYHTNEHPDYGMASCDIEHIKKHMTWCPPLQGGEIKSFDVKCITLEELFDKYSVEELDWLYLDIEGIDAEVLLTFNWQKYKIKRIEFEQLHLGCYKEAIKNMMIGMGYTQVNSLHSYDWAFENNNIATINEKLKNFPPINYISIEESEERRNLLQQKFNEYNLTNITPHIFKKYSDEEHQFVGNSINELLGMGRGPLTSHLKAIKDWYFNTDEEYAFFCEDDISFETVKYWNFTWEEFFSGLPLDWECIQLCWVREEMFAFSVDSVSLRHRCWCDWSACAYLMTRKHAKKIISHYYRDGVFNLDYCGEDLQLRPDWALRPTAETILFSSVGPVYGFPLFVEDVINCKTTLENEIGRGWNYSSHENIIDWWKNKGKNLTITDIIKV